MVFTVSVYKSLRGSHTAHLTRKVSTVGLPAGPQHAVGQPRTHKRGCTEPVEGQQHSRKACSAPALILPGPAVSSWPCMLAKQCLELILARQQKEKCRLRVGVAWLAAVGLQQRTPAKSLVQCIAFVHLLSMFSSSWYSQDSRYIPNSVIISHRIM